MKILLVLIFFLVLSIFGNEESKCILRLLRKYFRARTTIILADTDLQLIYPTIYKNLSKNDFKKFDISYPDVYVVTLREISIERMVKQFQQSNMFNSRAKFIILIESGNYSTVFQSLAKYFIYNVIILTPDGNILSYDPFKNEDAAGSNTQPIVLGNCETFNIIESNLLEKTLPQLWRNTTVTSIFTAHFPYLYLNKDGKLVGENMNTFKILQERLQFRLNTKNIIKNGTIISLIDHLRQGYDMALNYEPADETTVLEFDLGPMNLAAHFFWVVPRGQHIPYWKIFISHFELLFWFLILLFLLLLSSLWCYFEQKNFTSSLLFHYQILFESANFCVTKIQKISTRILCSTTVFTFLIFSTLFKGEILRSCTTYIYEYPIDSLNDVIKHNLECYASKDIIHLYGWGNSSYSKYIQGCTVVDIDTDQEELFLKIAKKQNTAIVSRKVKYNHALHKMYLMGYKKEMMHLVKKQIKFDFLFLHMKKGYPLYERVFEMMMRMQSYGFFIYFRQNMEKKAKKVAQKHTKLHSKTLTFKHVSMAFYLVIAGLGVSCFVFLTEIVYGK